MLNPNPLSSESYRPIPGPPDLILTGAIVQYRSRHEVAHTGGTMADVGIALVTEGRLASACVAVDLGSTRTKELDLSSELVVLAWVDRDTVDHVRRLLVEEATAAGAGRDAGPYCFALALRALREVGFSSVSRPSFLRIGFRDVLRDLDPDGSIGIRIRLGVGSVARIEVDAEGNALVVRSDGFTAPAALEAALAESFPSADLRKGRVGAGAEGEAGTYEVRMPHPQTLAELRTLVERLRSGMANLIWKYEPDRSKALSEQLDTFGRRDSLARLPEPDRTSLEAADSPGVTPVGPESRVVH